MCTFWLVEAVTRASSYDSKYLPRAINLFEASSLYNSRCQKQTKTLSLTTCFHICRTCCLSAITSECSVRRLAAAASSWETLLRPSLTWLSSVLRSSKPCPSAKSLHSMLSRRVSANDFLALTVSLSAPASDILGGCRLVATQVELRSQKSKPSSERSPQAWKLDMVHGARVRQAYD